MSELIWHKDASIELSTALPERYDFRGAQIAFSGGFVYIRPDPNNVGRSSNRVFVVPASAVVRAELPNGAAEL
ncbi:hypothetical protein AMK16_32355 [Streptomyces sp. CB00455]|uniref:hypothetical protein n=1 Tax=Streptomyces sp. CB00455 TaxID=1703927 RepID=UPI0009405C55|nr:hypothetical protein [Streptomyces sp. CB00455]OKK12237.1 hypothetical protein AMK16_32355 [Streptomyces sp. CB00455]